MMKYQLQDLDLEEDGPFRAFLDVVSETGVAKEDARLFATWLETTVFGLLEKLHTVTSDFREYCDEHPAVQIPQAQSFYFSQKEAASGLLAELRLLPGVADGAVQLEPGNGWMVVLVPGPADLSHLSHLAEIQDGRKRLAPVGKAKPFGAIPAPDKPVKGASPSSRGGGEGTAPVKGATALVWAIADTYVNEKGRVDRTAIIGLCTAAGINVSTAGTQYAKWKKTRGH